MGVGGKWSAVEHCERARSTALRIVLRPQRRYQDPALIKAIARGHAWFDELATKPWPISHGTGRSHASPSRRLPMDKITRLDGRFRYRRAVSMGGVMERRLGCYCHYTEEGGRNAKASSLLSPPVGSPDLGEGLMQ